MLKWICLLCFNSLSLALDLIWYGHSAFLLRTQKGTTILIDPWIQNPLNSNGRQILQDLRQIDYILLTHGHGDAIGDTKQILEQTKARIITTYCLSHQLRKILKFPADRLGNDCILDVGGEVRLADFRVMAVKAEHSSDVMDEEGRLYHAGPAVGYLISFDENKIVYHTGDTGLHMDMKLFPPFFGEIDLMLVCIGGQFTMGPKSAAIATSLVRPKIVVPMRYKTFTNLSGTPEEFIEEFQKFGLNTRVRVTEVNKVYDF